MSLLYYAGIGSRKNVPSFVMEEIRVIAQGLFTLGLILRSGGAQGCDAQFQRYAGHCDLFHPDDATVESREYVKNILGDQHWNRLYNTKWNDPDIGRKLQARNVLIMLGHDMKQPVQFVVCWTPFGRVSGGTGTGIKIAEKQGIPVFNYGSCDYPNDAKKMTIVITNHAKEVTCG